MNKSQLLRERHIIAKESRKLYEELSKDKIDVPAYSEFLKNDNPILKKIKVYDVSFQLNYPSKRKGQKSKEAFYIEKTTFKVYTIEHNSETENAIKINTLDTFRNLMSGSPKKELNPGLKTLIEDSSYYELEGHDKPRGLEEGEIKKLNLNILQNIKKGSFYVENLDNSVTIKNKSLMKYDAFVSDSYFK